MSNLELYMTATERTEDTEGKYSVLSVFSVAKSYKKHTRFSILNMESHGLNLWAGSTGLTGYESGSHHPVNPVNPV